MASTSIPPCKYDVFLSFRGEDTREGFTESQYQKLKWQGFNVFKDDTEPERGLTISEKLFRAIEESKTAVIIISPNYASSTWCLDELLKIHECMEVGNTVFPVFYGVDPSHVRKQLGTFAEAFEQHTENFKEDLARVKLWRVALRKLASFVGWTSVGWCEIELIKHIVEEVWNKVDPTFRLLGSSEKLVGVDSELKIIISHLELTANDVRFVGILGVSGIGKTTVARIIYERLSHSFEVSCFLENAREVSEKHGLLHLQNLLLFQILKVNFVEVSDVYGGSSMIKHLLQNKKVLLILDDVSELDQLETLVVKEHWFGLGSRIIVTTRNEQLLFRHGIVMLHRSVAHAVEAFRLFTQKAFKKDEPEADYVELTWCLVKYCGGHPLVLKIVGSFLYEKGLDIWNSTSDKLKIYHERSIVSLLEICYDGLKESEKRIFLDIACFFKGEHKQRVIKILDCYSVSACVTVEALVEKAFLTISNDNCVEMHDLLQELGWYIVRKECPRDPGRRSRLWNQEDIMEVLAYNKGTEAIEGILLSLWQDQLTTIEFDLNPEVFSKMCNLRFLKVQNLRMSLPQLSRYLPNSLRHFEWSCTQPDGGVGGQSNDS